MSRFRFSLLGLGGLVALIALGCAALVYANTWVAAAIWWLIYLVLAFAALAALVRSPPERMWWIGFALFGWLFALTIDGPLSTLNNQLQSHSVLHKAALTMPRAKITHTAIDHYGAGGYSGGMEMSDMPEMSSEGMDGGMAGTAGGSSASMGMGMGVAKSALVTHQTVDDGYVAAFVSTSHATLTLLIACLGGFAARLIQRWNQPDQAV